MTVDLVVKNAKLVTPLGITDGGLAVENGKVAYIGKEMHLPPADKVVDAKGKVLIPGIIDPHNHIGQNIYFPSEVEFETETRAAAIAGITTIITYQSTFETHEKVFPPRRKLVDDLSFTDVAFHAQILTESQLDEIPVCYKLGMTSFKFFMSYKGAEGKEYGLSGADDGMLYDGFSRIAKLPSPALAQVHAENSEVCFKIKERLIKEGRNDLSAWSDSRPPFQEEESMRRAIFLAKHAGCRLYVVHMSIGSGVQIVAEAMKEGIDVIAETLPAFLALTRNDQKIGVLGKVMCPLRDREDNEQLWMGIQNGVVQCVGSEHIASSKEKKKWNANVWEAKAGFPSVEALLPVLLSEGVNKGRITLERLVELCCITPARIFGLYPRKGTLFVGADADCVLVDLDKEVLFGKEHLRGSSDFSLFEGHRFKGWPETTILRGNVVVEDGKVIGKPGVGEFLSRPLS